MTISFEEAIVRLHEKLYSLPSVRLPLDRALGCVTAEAVYAEMSQPPFPRSPYDGYALRAADSAGASRENPVALRVSGRSFAGAPASASVGKGEAVRIMTGAQIPDGADCVIPQEQTDEGEFIVRIHETLRPFENYCRQGEDFQRSSRIIDAGSPVTAAVLGVAASAGCTELPVYPKPRVALLSTGDELLPPGQSLGSGQIYNSNGIFLAARLSELEIPVTENTVVDDDPVKLTRAIESMLARADFLILTGGVSVGLKDLVPAALETLGADLLFRGVALKPGMPATLVLLRGKPVLALSGNPLACSVTFELLARPALALLASDPRLDAHQSAACLAQTFSRARPVRRFQFGILQNQTVSVTSVQRNGQIRALVGCNCLAELPAGAEPLPAGVKVKVYLLGGELYGTGSPAPGEGECLCKPRRPRLLAVSGVKNSGKTTLIERLIPVLGAAGIRTAVIKHDGHRYAPDVPGTDSSRFFEAGACGTAVFDGEKYSITHRTAVFEETLAAFFPEADLILLEGFKGSSYPKLELVRGGVFSLPVCAPETCIALISDLTLDTRLPVFHFDAVEDISAFIQTFISGN